MQQQKMLGLLMSLLTELKIIPLHGTQQMMQLFEITGVQLEVGSVATDFEHRSFGAELYLCQRYFENITFSTLWFSWIC